MRQSHNEPETICVRFRQYLGVFEHLVNVLFAALQKNVYFIRHVENKYKETELNA